MKTLKKTRQLLMYLLAIVVLLFGTIALVYIAQGYSYDFKSGQIHNSGLVLIDSFPNGASIRLNNTSISNKTPYRYDSSPIGEISINLKKTGFRDWSTKQDVISGEVTFVEYPLLLPDVLSRQSVAQPVRFSSWSVSDDHKKAVATSSTLVQLYLINENGTTSKIYDTTAAKIDSVTISPDSKHALVRQTTLTGLVEQIIIDTSNNQIINLTNEFGFIFNNLQFSPEKSTDLLWLENGLLRKVDTTAHNISAAISTNVSSYSLSKNRIIVSVPGELSSITTTIISMNLSGGDKRNIAAMPADTFGYSALVIHSRSHSYLVLRANSSPNSIYSIYEPDSRNTLPLKLDEKVSIFSASPNQKFLSYLNDTGIHSIDLETGRHYAHDLDTKTISSQQWFDDYHLILHDGKYATLIDFDGYNAQTIVANSVFLLMNPSDSKSVMYLNTSNSLEKVYLEQR